MDELRNKDKLEKLIEKPPINKFLEWVDKQNELIWVVRKDYINVYFGGLVYAKISGNGVERRPLYDKVIKELKGQTPECRLGTLMDKCNFEKIQKLLKKTDFYKRNTERRNQQIIFKKSRENKENGIFIVDYEFALNKVHIDKKAEIDLLAVKLRNKRIVDIFAIEYKCNDAACNGDENGSGIKGHCNDFYKISENEELCKELVNCAKVAYEMSTGSTVKSDDCKLKFALLFSNNPKYKDILTKTVKKPDKLYIWKIEDENTALGEPELLTEEYFS